MTAFYQYDEYDGSFETYVVRSVNSVFYDNDVSWWLVPGTFSLED